MADMFCWEGACQPSAGKLAQRGLKEAGVEASVHPQDQRTTGRATFADIHALAQASKELVACCRQGPAWTVADGYVRWGRLVQVWNCDRGSGQGRG